jgi:hypothetical protein
MARPSSFTREIADEICDRLLEGESMRQICSAEHMPNRATVLRWMAANQDFAAMCARAREEQADLMDDLILDEARQATPDTAQVAKVRISAYQWRASKLAPKKYGDKLQHTGDGGGPIQGNLTVQISFE